jgi:3-dehydroquinate synthase
LNVRLFLSGPMGSGKSTLASKLAARTGLPAFDLDREIEARAGTSVSRIFEERGEAAFRALERSTLSELTRAPSCVIALGGGSVTSLETRRELLAQGTLITLDAPTEELVARVGKGEGRPLLAGQDVAARLSELRRARAAAYAECHAVVSTAKRDTNAVVDELLELHARELIVVPMGERSYRIEVGPGVRARVPDAMRALGASALVVSDEVVGPLWGSSIARAIETRGLTTSEVIIPAGEAHKTIETVGRIWDAALDGGLDRGSALLGVGGGVVGDLTGFAAATFLRGVPVGHMPTTLLAMVDSAIGGKTGFDTRHGKNLVGAFHQPSFVLCDTDVLATLPLRELRAGLGEVVKAAWIDGEASVARIERDARAICERDTGALIAAIRMSAQLKARVVTADEREGGYRAVLNLGHTVGHAIEAAGDYRGYLHGEAVALGMVAAFRLSLRFGAATQTQAQRMTRLLDALGLPTDIDAALDERALSYLSADKKRRGGALTLVLPAEPGATELKKVPLAAIEAELRSWLRA